MTSDESAGAGSDTGGAAPLRRSIPSSSSPALPSTSTTWATRGRESTKGWPWRPKT